MSFQALFLNLADIVLLSVVGLICHFLVLTITKSVDHREKNDTRPWEVVKGVAGNLCIHAIKTLYSLHLFFVTVLRFRNLTLLRRVLRIERQR